MQDKAFSLLRSALWQIPCHESITDSDWVHIMHFMRKQALDGIIPDALALMTSSPQRTKVKMRMIGRQLLVERANLKMNEELISFTKELEKKNIPHVLLKGQGIGTLYPFPQHRVSGDIDLYVPKDYIRRVNDGLLAFGGKRGEENRHHIDYSVNGILWELHHCIFYFQKDSRNIRFMQYVDEALKDKPVYVNVGCGNVRVLPPTTNVLLLLSHILDHFYCQGIGLRQLCDLAILLDKEHDNINPQKLQDSLKELALERCYRIFGYICVKYIGLAFEKLMIKPTKSDEQLAHKIIKDCIQGGNFGRNAHSGRKTFLNWISYYTRFILRLIKFYELNPSEALWWPLAKLKRLFTGTIIIRKEKSVLN